MPEDQGTAWLFLLAAAAALVVYIGGLALVARAGRLAAVGAIAIAIQLTPLGAPLLLSTDAWTYWSYGRIAAVHDGNPYRDSPADFPTDPATPFVGSDWRDSTSVYGPAFTLASEPLARAAGASEDAAAWAYKALAAAAVLAAALLAARLSRRPAYALAFVGWNPLLALHFGGGGHNDAWMAALAVGALALAATGRRTLSGAAWALAVFVKWIPLLFVPLHLLAARGAARRAAAGAAAALIAVTATATWRYGGAWVETLGPLARNARTETRFAIPHRLEQLGLPDALALALAAGAFAIAYVVLLRRAQRGEPRLGLAAGLLLLATPYLAPWYAVWAVPFAAAEDDRPAQLLALALCAYLLPQTVPI